ncbi:helix-turn-helix transcriptional regulator [Infirmifilum lucidum]|uniref:Helix-turn-helix transcriptional regulator n=1 Tax=Infirmifilum lucidum TaxID=2776706 RepID=A0A7L9FL27_9CREN|nr:winged helix-turn-helix transcriptional regulator [Infirmifilum lucidum]QOJ79654.1 helix-turn-helix transcriptional regulator [Infirmifilum lucidum]
MRVEEEVEQKVQHVLRGISETLEKFMQEEKITLSDIRGIIIQLEPSFKLLSRKWTLTLLYTLLIAGSSSFNSLHRITGINKRSLSIRLRELEKNGLVKREAGGARVNYKLTDTGRDTALLMIPLIYYISRRMPQPVT